MGTSFSQRHGHTPLTKKLQIEDMDADLVNSIWSVIYKYYFVSVPEKECDVRDHEFLYPIFYDVWVNFLKITFDENEDDSCDFMIERLKEIFFRGLWYKKYDFIEYLTQNHEPYEFEKTEFIKACNNILEREFSGYRFVGDIISPITSKEEIREVEEAINSGIPSLKNHFETAVSLLSDKKSPNYRNSIKESISAVESICKMITGNSDATMNSALKEIEQKGIINLHSDMKETFKKLYNYTSDASRIRHSLIDGKIESDFDDAKFMLVSCSAIVNYLISKSNKAKISLI